MIAAVDVHYRDSRAVAACALFSTWEAATAARTFVETIDHVEPYVPGQFYKRELPCIIRVLARSPMPEVIVVDGFVWLGREKPGLGAHLYEARGRTVPIVGVAKSPYRGAGPLQEIFRGSSKKPLLVSVVGMPLSKAAQHIRAMHGVYRLPTMLSHVDRLCRRGPQ
jgi:deoxyribonuclease V